MELIVIFQKGFAVRAVTIRKVNIINFRLK